MELLFRNQISKVKLTYKEAWDLNPQNHEVFRRTMNIILNTDGCVRMARVWDALRFGFNFYAQENGILEFLNELLSVDLIEDNTYGRPTYFVKRELYSNLVWLINDIKTE